MKSFLGDNFLLSNEIAEALYHDFAKDQPIIDYHNHLSPELIAKDHQFENISEAWLHGDHYKWRAMRANGIDEKYITGSASDADKFEQWAKTVPYTLRNPLYHWTHLELQRYFGVSTLLSPDTSKEIYQEVNRQLQQKSHSCEGLLKSRKVELLCTTDDPTDDLSYHQQIQQQSMAVKVYPTFRPDKALGLGDPKSYLSYLEKLGSAAGITIQNLDTLLEALQQRVDHFHHIGGRISDLGFNQLPYLNPKEKNRDANFKSILEGKNLNIAEVEDLQAYILTELCKMYHTKGWAQQFHLGALRNNNERALRELGPDTGYDSMGDFDQADRISRFLNNLDNTDQLAKTILYNLNSRDNDLLATMAGNFNDGKTVGKIQFGSGWWFLDQKTGMENQMNSLSNMGLLSRFIGMLTDSRSFLSFPRHEYFRRILCNLIGTDVVNGELPNDIQWLGSMVNDICYHNAKNYFEFEQD
ncbi:glucuronate isomerase [Reichenbachiella carrageenanivorans]|uniref:Uronate isomerase n=1 Tax=Reichenbachiella carrageenanivorans TaxID=2979869 RepID=A0ABY6CZF9_9BACT|nr:glucuronate isomerase [Reichenbachiella carrageenanivorans]UXX79089.1 glucuronate isomerase [Reichenbachiella carrageenanivorans]